MDVKTELFLVKTISFVNQILLVHCFLQMMFADFFRTETEADYFYHEGDDDERTLMDRADSLSTSAWAFCVSCGVYVHQQQKINKYRTMK